ncbi:MAG: hypothetical protein HYY16_03615, partial [Planctomycetes bacterium]|nr:hypothetical protein [Planctomycetota bacterium]
HTKGKVDASEKFIDNSTKELQASEGVKTGEPTLKVEVGEADRKGAAEPYSEAVEHHAVAGDAPAQILPSEPPLATPPELPEIDATSAENNQPPTSAGIAGAEDAAEQSESCPTRKDLESVSGTAHEGAPNLERRTSDVEINEAPAPTLVAPQDAPVKSTQNIEEALNEAADATKSGGEVSVTEAAVVALPEAPPRTAPSETSSTPIVSSPDPSVEDLPSDDLDVETESERETEVEGILPPAPLEAEQETTADPELESPAVEKRKKVPTKRPMTPRQYRPIARTPTIPTKPNTTGVTTGEPTERERALRIEVRLALEKGGFCRVSLLPHRSAALPNQFAVSGSGSPPELIALQEEWYQDVALPAIGSLLRNGVEWGGTLDDGGSVRWSLSGREVFVLCRHGDLSGFVTLPRLLLGEEHVVLCTANRLPEVKEAIATTGSPHPTVLDQAAGIPEGWLGLKGVIPRTPIPPSPTGDILDALRPLANVELVLEGGIRLERATWLAGYPPRIRLRGDAAAAGNILIDGQSSVLTAAGTYAAPGWDTPGKHSIWCLSASKTYWIREGAEAWEPWDAYTWSMGEFILGGTSRPAICGVVVRPPMTAHKDSRPFVAPASNCVLVGAVPGQLHTCDVRTELLTRTCIGFPWFEPVWAIPVDSLRCDKRTARVLRIGGLLPVQSPARPTNRGQSRLLSSWCAAILDAGRKGLQLDPGDPDTLSLWREYKRQARTIRRSPR